MIKWTRILAVVFTAALLNTAVATPNANAILVSAENFEGGASGWSNNTTTVGSPAFTEFLGIFSDTSGSPDLFKVYPLSGLQTSTLIQFDFYEIDAWDNGLFGVFIDDALISGDAFSVNIYDTPLNAANLLPASPGFEDLGFGLFPDQTYRYSFLYPTTDAAIKIAFGTILDPQAPAGWGIDNVVISDNTQAGGPTIPEPATMLLFTSGMAGIFLKRKRRS